MKSHAQKAENRPMSNLLNTNKDTKDSLKFGMSPCCILRAIVDEQGEGWRCKHVGARGGVGHRRCLENSQTGGVPFVYKLLI
jgi:hypothetical protein